MLTSAYYVTVQTRDAYATAEYVSITGQLVNALQCTLGSLQELSDIMHSTKLTNASVEVEVAQSELTSTSPITARCVVRADAPGKLVFDKNLFTAKLTEAVDMPVKVTKRVVSKDELAAAAVLVED